MKKYIYLAGPISGCSVKEALDWRAYVQDLLPEGIVGISPLRCEPSVEGTYSQSYDDLLFGTVGAITSKNDFDVRSCDLILAYLPDESVSLRPSYGTMFEIAWALELRKPVIIVSDNEFLVNNALVKFKVPWILPDLKSAVTLIRGLMDDYTK